ncbi:hypothetical protein MNB_SM-4-1130 [hydrothermal vent metagenome]|uniref:Uncharacterized protein n=1 Tax=hydrothermal vent metagenome TaxID=652676 RepID=A0A1W1CIG5_9ZZZZ
MIQQGAIQTYLVGTDGLLRSPFLKEDSQILQMRIDTEQINLWQSEYGVHDETVPTTNEDILIYKNSLGKDVFGLHVDIDILGVHFALVSEADMLLVINIQNAIIEKTLIITLILLMIIIIVAILSLKMVIETLNSKYTVKMR